MPGIVRVITRLNIGGPARQALLLSSALAPEFETTLLAGTPPPEEGELVDDEVEIHRVPLVRPLRPATDVRALRDVRAEISARRPAIVHSHMAKAGAITRLAARGVRCRPKTIHTFHGHVLEGYFSKSVQRAFIGAERALARITDVLIAVSPEIRDSLIQLGIGRLEQYEVVPLGFDLRRLLTVDAHSGLLRDQLDLADDVPLAGLVGRLAPVKDPALALRAVARVPGLHLAVVGDGELAGQTRQLALDLSIGDRVHFTGWMTDIAGVMADLDIALLTSRNEGTPVALIEAAAAGVPAVAIDVGGVRSVVVDGETGILLPDRDERQIAEVLEQLAGDAALRLDLGRNGRQRAALWDQRRLIEDLRAIYRDVLNR